METLINEVHPPPGKYVGRQPIKLHVSIWKDMTDFEALERQKYQIQEKPKLLKKSVLHKGDNIFKTRKLSSSNSEGPPTTTIGTIFPFELVEIISQDSNFIKMMGPKALSSSMKWVLAKEFSVLPAVLYSLHDQMSFHNITTTVTESAEITNLLIASCFLICLALPPPIPACFDGGKTVVFVLRSNF
ncbi:hypothetical protein HHK36_020471 [Tetracentron sinense]|uniref:Uncharacterized protein n=1 Tax=Tetracentron sinense TaxID=13715 RepID=A0A835DBN1_TETSI|nr:hypothetical protein HHK36_020471 [Tetracentron sinense]